MTPKGVRAATAVARLNAATEQYWADRAAGFDAEALRQYEANVVQSVAFGFEPISQRKLLALDGPGGMLHGHRRYSRPHGDQE